MKIVVKMDLAQGRGSICWKGVSWRRVWGLCVAVGGLLVAGHLMAQTNGNIAKPVPGTGHRPR